MKREGGDINDVLSGVVGHVLEIWIFHYLQIAGEQYSLGGGAEWIRTAGAADRQAAVLMRH